jgi:hypothetical protein
MCAFGEEVINEDLCTAGERYIDRERDRERQRETERAS